MEKLINTAQTLDKVLVLVRGLIVIASVLAVAGSAVSVFAADFIIGKINEVGVLPFQVNAGAIKFTTAAAEFSPENFRALMLAVIAATAIFAAIALYSIYLLRNVLCGMKDGRPFAENTPKRIRQIAYTVFFCSVAVPAAAILPEYFLFRFIGLGQITITSSVAERLQIGVDYSIDIMTIMTGFVVLLLSYVFEYGARLQTEADETL